MVYRISDEKISVLSLEGQVGAANDGKSMIF